MKQIVKIPVAIFGGSFDPIHSGHMLIANFMKEYAETIVFVPCMQNPQSKIKPIASVESRLHMIKLAIKDEKNYELSKYELERDQLSYTLDTINYFYKKHACKIGLLLGADTFLSFKEWWKPEEILQKAKLFIFQRPGVNLDEVKHLMQDSFFSKSDLTLLEEKSYNISSTQVKIYSYLREDISQFVPAKVASYIVSKALYQLPEQKNISESFTKEKIMGISEEIIQEHGLTLEEYEKIKILIKREPNITELGMFSVLWSEHCAYKNSKPLLKTFPTTGERVLQGPGENAGIVDIGDGLAVSFKIESHNHPSAIEPYQGAATGAGGIIRDIFAMGARPIACLDSLRFGDITKDKQSRHLFEYVVKGIGDYGNCVGIPTVAGEVYFEDTYQDNCLVNAMCVGIVQSSDKQVSSHYGPIVKGVAKGEGNLVVYAGAATGRDGIHGATFASVELSEESAERKSSVQVGDPFQEKLLIEACLELLKTDCVVGLGDMGAAGLTSSLSEMATRGNHGIEIDVALVPQREKHMTAYEIMLSESQERMVVVVEKAKLEEALKILKKWDIYATVIGKVTTDNCFRVMNKDKVEADIPAKALTDEAPIYHRKATKPKYLATTQKLDLKMLEDTKENNAQEILQKLLTAPNIASKKWVYEQYDYMVQTNTLVYPGKADAAVLNIKDTNKRIAVKTDGNGRLTYLDPKIGGKIAVAEASRNVACTGARPLAMTNCLNFGNPEKPESFWQLKEAVAGMAEACRVLDTPVISGNVSLYNESENGSIYPTPVVGILGLFDGDYLPATMSFKKVEDLIYLVGASSNELGGSEYLKTIHKKVAGIPADVDLQVEKKLQDNTINCIKNGLVNSAHDVSDGGLAVALAECLFSTGLGAEIKLVKVESLRNDSLLFGESQSRIIFSVDPSKKGEFESVFKGMVLTCIGKTNSSKLLDVFVNEKKYIGAEINSLEKVYTESISTIMGMQ